MLKSATMQDFKIGHSGIETIWSYDYSSFFISSILFDTCVFSKIFWACLVTVLSAIKRNSLMSLYFCPWHINLATSFSLVVRWYNSQFCSNAPEDISFFRRLLFEFTILNALFHIALFCFPAYNNMESIF